MKSYFITSNGQLTNGSFIALGTLAVTVALIKGMPSLSAIWYSFFI